VYSDTPVSSGFLAAVGCRVYTGTRYLPDIDHFALFASHGLDLNALNRLGYLDGHAVPPGARSEFDLDAPVIVRWNVAPQDPTLRQIGIRYLAFDARPAAGISNGLISLSSQPIDGFWLYKLP
jgi:hypothetical protein